MSAALPAAGLRLVKTNEDVEVHVYNVALPSESEEKKSRVMFREKYHLEFVQLIYYITHYYSESVTLGKENIFFILTKKMFSWQKTFHC